MVSPCEIGMPDNDNPADTLIGTCLNPNAPRSFFLYAGAGSGKTYSLVKALADFEKLYGNKFRKTNKRIAVITYTNAACDEIVSRVKNDPLFHISTIHSFCWFQIKNFHEDIRKWLLDILPFEISKLKQDEAKGRAGTQASIIRQRSILNINERLEWLSKRREFTYNPNGENIGKASLSHSEVLNVCAYLLVSKPTFQQIIINRYPFLLIDESQDTNKHLIEALITVETQRQGYFGLGLFGDMMQRIYGDGKANLEKAIPDHWEKPFKQLNRRSFSRIVKLANDIRSEVDQQEQKVLEGKLEGHVRLFIAPANKSNKPHFEHEVREEMAQITDDALWNNFLEVKHLMLEHMMAAVRMGFDEMFSALGAQKKFHTALRSGDLPFVKLFSEYIYPVYELEKKGKANEVMAHLRRTMSPLIAPDFLRSKNSDDSPLQPAKVAISSIFNLIDTNKSVTFLEVLQCVAEHNLFTIPQNLIPFSKTIEFSNNVKSLSESSNEEEDSFLTAIQKFLETPFWQIKNYKSYVNRQAPFDTHQGVKGLEFERVMVVMDDEAAGGFLFSYEKMFDVKLLTKNDLNNLEQGEETSIDRTRRLFYVTCTRAERSLALVAYSQDPQILKDRTVSKGWFTDSEVIIKT